MQDRCSMTDATNYTACRATPAAQTSTSTRGGADGATVTEAEQTSILRKQHLLTLPLLMDVCALYAPSNPALVKKLMQQAMHLLPELQQVSIAMLFFRVQNCIC